MQSGHVLIDRGGQLLSIDSGFGSIMQAEPASLIGRAVIDITAPADRLECSEAIARLRATRQPFEISKRFIRDDGSLVWVTNTVSIVDHGRDADLMVATISPMVDRENPRAPALLLDCANMLSRLHEDRATVFDASLFSDTAWDAILAAYIAEAEGRAITVPALAEKLGISHARADRWIAILCGQRIIEIETRVTDAYAAKSFRLTSTMHARLEEHLERAATLQGVIRRKSLTY